MMYNTIGNLLKSLKDILEKTNKEHIIGPREEISEIISSYRNAVSLGVFSSQYYYAFLITTDETIETLFTKIGIPLNLCVNITINGAPAQYDSKLAPVDWIFIKPKIKYKETIDTYRLILATDEIVDYSI